MSVKSYVATLENSEMFISYMDFLMPEARGIVLNHGDVISGMIRICDAAVRELYTNAAQKAVDTYFKIFYSVAEEHGSRGSMGSKLFLGISEILRPAVRELDMAHPELIFHTHLLSQLLCDLLTSPVYDFDIAKEITDMSGYETALRKHFKLMPHANKMDKPTVEEYFTLCIDVILDDLAGWSAAAKREISRIYRMESDPDCPYGTMDSEERLYFLDNTVDFEESSNVFKYAAITYNTVMVTEPKAVDKANSYKGGGVSVGSRPRMRQMLELKGIEQLLEHDFLWLIKSGAQIKKCRHCGGFFLPHGRKDAEYCDYTAPGEEKTCTQVGALRKYESKVKNSPILQMYNRAYKRMNGRVKYGSVTRDDFAAWSKQARSLRDRCEKGELDPEQFREWLDSDVV